MIVAVELSGIRLMLAKTKTRTNLRTILIVEDSPFDQRIMVRALRRSEGPVPIVVAETLASARRALEDQPMRHVFLDNSLPDGNGADFVMDKGVWRLIMRTPVTLVTDWPSPFMFEKAKSAGITVLQKSEFIPARIQTLLSD